MSEEIKETVERIQKWIDKKETEEKVKRFKKENMWCPSEKNDWVFVLEKDLGEFLYGSPRVVWVDENGIHKAEVESSSEDGEFMGNTNSNIKVWCERDEYRRKTGNYLIKMGVKMGGKFDGVFSRWDAIAHRLTEVENPLKGAKEALRWMKCLEGKDERGRKWWGRLEEKIKRKYGEESQEDVDYFNGEVIEWLKGFGEYKG